MYEAKLNSALEALTAPFFYGTKTMRIRIMGNSSDAKESTEEKPPYLAEVTVMTELGEMIGAMMGLDTVLKDSMPIKENIDIQIPCTLFFNCLRTLKKYEGDIWLRWEEDANEMTLSNDEYEIEYHVPFDKGLVPKINFAEENGCAHIYASLTDIRKGLSAAASIVANDQLHAYVKEDRLYLYGTSSGGSSMLVRAAARVYNAKATGDYSGYIVDGKGIAIEDGKNENYLSFLIPSTAQKILSGVEQASDKITINVTSKKIAIRFSTMVYVGAVAPVKITSASIERIASGEPKENGNTKDVKKLIVKKSDLSATLELCNTQVNNLERMYHDKNVYQLELYPKEGKIRMMDGSVVPFCCETEKIQSGTVLYISSKMLSKCVSIWTKELVHIKIGDVVGKNSQLLYLTDSPDTDELKVWLATAVKEVAENNKKNFQEKLGE